MQRQKLVYILHELKVGGVEVALISAIPLLYKEYELRVVVLGTIEHSLIAHLTEAEQGVFQCFDFPLYTYPFKVSKIVNYIVGLRPDYLVSSLWRSSWVGWLVHRKLPEVQYCAFVHSSVFFHRLDAFFTKKAIRSADAVFVDSVSAKHFIEQVAGIQINVRIVSFLTFYTPDNNTVLARRAAAPNNRIRFMFMGRINKVKNLPETITLIGLLVKQGYDLSLDIYGRPDDDFEQAQQRVKDLGLGDCIQFKGEINPNFRFETYGQYDFYIQLSMVEGMAMSVAEAMQNGLVCIVTPVGEIPNYSEDQTSALFLDMERGSSEGLAKIEALLNDEATYLRISQNCYRAFRDKKTFPVSLIEQLKSLKTPVGGSH